MLHSQEASEAGWRMMDMQSERGQLLSAVAWALHPDQLRLLGQVKGDCSFAVQTGIS